MNRHINRISWALRTMLVGCAVLTASAAATSQIAAQLVATLPENDRVNSLAFAPDGKSLAAACGVFHALLQEPRPGKVVIWNVATRKNEVSLGGHADGITCAIFTPDQKMLVTAAYSGEIKFWDTATARSVDELDGKIGPVLSLAISRDGKKLVAGGWNHAFAVWEVASRKMLATIAAHEGPVSAVCLLRDNRTVATGSDEGSVKLWDVDNRRELRSLTLHRGDVHQIANSPDGNMLAVASGNHVTLDPPHKPDGGIRLWSARDWKEIADVPLREATWTVAFSPDGKRLAAAGSGGVVRILDAAGREKETLSGHDGWIRSVCFAPNGALLAAGGDSIKLWTMSSASKSAD